LTADECISRAQLIYPSIPSSSASSPDGLDLLNEVLGELLFDIELLSSEVDISLTAGTAHYTVTTPMRVWSARYVRTSATGDFRDLVPVSQDLMDSRRQDHLRTGNAEPTEFWMLPKSDGTQELWLSPAPPTTTSASYPKVTLRHTKYVALTNSADLPIGLPSYEAFYLGLALKWGTFIGDPKVGDIERKFEKAKLKLMNFRHSVNARVRPQIVPNVRWRTRKV